MSITQDSKQENALNQTQSETKFEWTPQRQEKLKELHIQQQGNWKSISALLDGPTPLECMYKWQQLHPNLVECLWTLEEDEQLKELVQKFGKKWSKICTVMDWRTGKQVRERYLNQLQGTINQDKWTEEEDKLILKLYRKFGTKWSYISSFLKGRPENMVKNRYYANLKRRYQCDLDDSDDDDIQEDSVSSQEDDKIKLLKRRRLPISKKEEPKSKKIQTQEVCSENCQILTRSKVNKQKDENSQKIVSSNEDQNIKINSGCQNITSNLNDQVLNVKEENQQQLDHNNFNSIILQQSYQPYKSYQDSPMILNNNVFQQFINNNMPLKESSPKITQDQNSVQQQLLQTKQQPFKIPQLPYVINQYPGIQMMNPFLGFVSPQQQYLYQLPCQSNQINYLNKWNEFSTLYNNQLLQNGLQP
ncbi:unnamed protein product (macronuclear) [Paramecium tetraurelia]|uniref:Homeodomain protein n=1 Tax=Paramecium tetraurelia TaxID=5888 RepID=A0DES5_PARTE|nr:uncharacterized protein GSPATT00016368001 [Paramecium tetraurelia]CAK81542.1 unnamed protein product [Paramecium tetraurelia]|eukprot:XP_001448939.1 hypothetical protein (macronuclear) [Paramecium tetraurelia strain d4-2]